MAGVTDTGWVPKNLDTLVDELAEAAESEFGEDFPTTPDSVFGQFANILSASNVDLWQLGQAIIDTQNRDTAEGIYLNYLAAIIGLSRLEDSGSTGYMLFTGNVGTTVSSGTVCKDNLSRKVTTDTSVELSRAACYTSTYSIKTISDTATYTINVEGTDYSFVPDVSGITEVQILTGLAEVLDQGSDISAEVVDSTVVLTFGYTNNTMTTTNTSNITLVSVGSLISSTAVTTGDLTFEADTITSLVSTNITIISVTNPFDFVNGRDEETDAELRLRMEEEESETGTATLDAIESSLSDVDSVTKVLVVENDTLNTFDDGQVGKSFQCYVVGGSDDDIATTIWQTKPAGIATYGNSSATVIDNNGNEKTVYFSRKVDLYAWVVVTYSFEDDGSDFPSTGESLLADAVITYGEALDDGEDFIPSRMYEYLYSVDGCLIDSIEIATTTSEGVVPTYQTTKISIEDTEVLNFDLSRVTVSGS